MAATETQLGHFTQLGTYPSKRDYRRPPNEAMTFKHVTFTIVQHGVASTFRFYSCSQRDIAASMLYDVSIILGVFYL